MKPVFEKPKVFISHGRAGESLDVFRSFFESLDFHVIVVIDEPSTGMALSEKVKKFIKDCDCVFVLATPDNKDEVSGTYQPRANVSHEIGYAEALSKPIIYLKHRDVVFGTNYSDKVWISFSNQDYHIAYKQIIDEIKKIKLVSIVGKVNKESIKSEIIEKILRLVDILNITDSEIRSNILYNLSLALYGKSKLLTPLETQEFFEFYPEYTQSCAYDGYKNENLYGAIKLMSFSLQLNPVSFRKADYILMLCDALYVGEGMLDEDVKKELNTLIIGEAREGSLFVDERHIKNIIFYLEILEDQNRKLFWGKACSADEISPQIVEGLKIFLFGFFGGEWADSASFAKPTGYPVFIDRRSIDMSVSDGFAFKTSLSVKIENSAENEKRLMFRFLSEHFDESDIAQYLNILRNSDDDVRSRVLWVMGENCTKISTGVASAFLDIFNKNNHKLIGLLATALGKINTERFNLELIQALKEFKFESRRWIIWAMGKIKSLEFFVVVEQLDIDENNYALEEEAENTLKNLQE